jgi:hypothetical protein
MARACKILVTANERAESSHDVKPALFDEGRDGFPDCVAANPVSWVKVCSDGMRDRGE